MRKDGLRVFSMRGSGQFAFPIGRGKSVVYLIKKGKKDSYKIGITVKTSEINKFIGAV